MADVICKQTLALSELVVCNLNLLHKKCIMALRIY